MRRAGRRRGRDLPRPPLIRHAERPHQTVVADARGCLAAFGSVFVASGLLALVLSTTDGDAPATARLVGALIGASHVAAGLWVALGTACVSLVDADGVTVETRRWLRLVASRRIPVEAIASVRVDEDRDSDGDATYRPALCLHSGETVALATQTTPSADAARVLAEAIARRLGRPDAVEW